MVCFVLFPMPVDLESLPIELLVLNEFIILLSIDITLFAIKIDNNNDIIEHTSDIVIIILPPKVSFLQILHYIYKKSHIKKHMGL